MSEIHLINGGILCVIESKDEILNRMRHDLGIIEVSDAKNAYIINVNKICYVSAFIETPDDDWDGK